ncbi:Brefeldin A-inhibited guanine nucleotide-exchange protein 2 [Auxenochlorella protothecoides]|uniref:Brefeldin A-inhibited guanine nucleotide-exchange protein 2 n=1 Tax=Auxenochlorella protothecoides TaxID=3075 RepID=A0A087SNX8_AUXPR|nr:Brefeldin A-inhibited guanine nucleotide-exchange protein 2 [Auxenochlorella protothecoides]KFM27432.1 Brefeldin A-inhibited guanine nucleotide-exchange protein 2 [Auxenochlorella protothecoides]
MLQAACSSGAPSIMDPALGTLHKLVAHAFLQGESSSSGRGDDGTIVTQVVTMVARTGVSTTPAVQLGMVRALLTAVTAEHFVPHGDCLMQAVRAVFNLAIGSSDPGIQATAKSALLQMLNTVLKRVDHQVMTPMGVSPGGPTPTLHRRMSTPTSQASLPTPYPYPPALESVDEEGASAPQSGADFVPPRADGEGAGPRSGDESTKPGEQQRVPGSEVSPASGRPSPDRADHAEDEAEWRDDPATLEAAALAWGERVASASESREAAAPGAPAPSPPGSPSAADLRQSELAPIATPTAAIELHSRSMAREDIRTAQMATMAEQADLRGLERALEELPASGPRPGDEGRSKAETPPDPRRALMHSRRASAWRLLTTIERDAITVLGAMCKLGARETSWGAVETVLHEGKLLALELLTRVLCDPLHDWLGVRPEFAGELRAPLCLVLLRNCMPESVFQAEAALEGLLPICSSPQILVDVFVNYDCSLQASNLYERSIKALGRMASLTGSEGFGPPAATKRLKEAALKALLAVVSSLDTWAGPIKSRMRRLVESGLVGPSALEVAAFLREHGPRLKKEALGEYFGHHEEFEMTVMHEFIAAQAFTETTLDAALRQLLVDFRLPGEAQKIDRIMEAFAARYCACNPNAFPTTDGAYLLSFAIIMLNTDAHNPMADRRISEDDFLVAPLWPGAAAWDKAHGVDVERRRLASLTREVVAAGGTAGNLWHSATHAEHARPMLQAGAAPLAAGLAAALADAASPPEVARALAGLERAAALAALLSVPELLEELCAVLARGAGLEGGAEDGASRVAGASLPPPGSPAEAKQVACLACLLKVATCPEATYFGAVWIVLLRALSALDALLARLAPPAGDAAAAAAAELSWLTAVFSRRACQSSSPLTCMAPSAPLRQATPGPAR